MTGGATAVSRDPEHSGPDYDARISRAEFLADELPFSNQVLGFYLQLAGVQKDIYFEIQKGSRLDPQRIEPNYSALLEHLPRLLGLLQNATPEPMAEAARQLSSQSGSAWVASLSDFWRNAGRRTHVTREEQDGPLEAVKELILRALLQPYSELLAQGLKSPSADERPGRCPRCQSEPLLGVLRPEGDGAKRCLVCSFCFTEWDFRRILCPACGETAEKKLPVYVAEQLPHVRIEACDSCNSYLRTIDLTENGRAIPIVDDLAAIPLSLWAEDRGYRRLQSNLLRT